MVLHLCLALLQVKVWLLLYEGLMTDLLDVGHAKSGESCHEIGLRAEGSKLLFGMHAFSSICLPAGVLIRQSHFLTFLLAWSLQQCFECSHQLDFCLGLLGRSEKD